MKRSRTAPQPSCIYCHQPIPPYETARTLNTPPGHQRLPTGSGWIICGPDCPDLPDEAQVFYRSTKPVSSSASTTGTTGHRRGGSSVY